MNRRALPPVLIGTAAVLVGAAATHRARRLPDLNRRFEEGEIDKDSWAVDQFFVDIEAGAMALLALFLIILGVRGWCRNRA